MLAYRYVYVCCYFFAMDDRSIDESLYCVSAWNDNGQGERRDVAAVGVHGAAAYQVSHVADNKQFYRSDVFPGLGMSPLSLTYHLHLVECCRALLLIWSCHVMTCHIRLDDDASIME
jgi:hypothetical protein